MPEFVFLSWAAVQKLAPREGKLGLGAQPASIP